MPAKLIAALVVAMVCLVGNGWAQDEPQTSDPGLACRSACDVVNAADRTVQGTIIPPYTQPAMDQARETVNNSCGNSCEKPRSTGTSSSPAR
jgi:hypothetical protein